jgi:xylulokinase
MSKANEKIALGIDLGTGSLKLVAIVGDTSYSASRTYNNLSPEADIAETDPEEWILALRETWSIVRSQLIKDGRETDIASIGISGQMHGFVPISEKGETLHNAILWADSRGSEFLDASNRSLAPFFDRILNAPAAGLTALTLLWIKKYRSDLYERTGKILFPKDYLRFRLTGEIATDPGDASASLLYDFQIHNWSEEALAVLGLDREKLPEIRDSFHLAGYITNRASKETGLPVGVPLAIGSADTSCALYGSGIFSDFFIEREYKDKNDWIMPNRAQISIGTAAQVIAPVKSIPQYNPALNFFESCVQGVGYRMAAMLNGGLALEWVLSSLESNWDSFYSALDSGKVSLSKDLLFLPYLAGERSPYRNPNARGAWIGIGMHHKKNDLLAAALLGVACTVRLGLETLGMDQNASILFVGGSSRKLSWMRIVASVLEHSIEVSAMSDVSARGAAAIGLQSVESQAFSVRSVPALSETTNVKCERLPWMSDYYRRFKACYSALYGENGAY